MYKNRESWDLMVFAIRLKVTNNIGCYYASYENDSTEDFRFWEWLNPGKGESAKFKLGALLIRVLGKKSGHVIF